MGFILYSFFCAETRHIVIQCGEYLRGASCRVLLCVIAS
jgi:hypothetical protein